MSETALVAAVLRYVNTLEGCYAWRNNTGSLQAPSGRWVSFGCPGSADIIGLYKGRFLGIECKARRGVMRQGQTVWGARVTRLGGLYVVARSVEDVRRALLPGAAL